MIRLVDDQQLGRLLRTPDPAGDAVYTTGYWYVRLCQAVLTSDTPAGVLSAPFAALPDAMRDRAIRGLLELPDHIGLVSLRELGPLIGQLRARHQLNILGMEVLAAGIHLAAGADVGADRDEVTVELSARSPKLEAALQAEGVSVRIV